MASTLLTGGSVRDPALQGRRDVLIVGDTVVAVLPAGRVESVRTVVPDVTVVDIGPLTLIPGVVDGHLHVVGGGGGSGLASRIPELPVDAILEAGITTCVAMPGVDTLSKPPTSLLARARALTEQGVRCRVMAGGFHWPPPVSTTSVRDELYLLDDVVGVKIALQEHLATAPSRAELSRLLTELLWLRGATGKACLLHVHLGLGKQTSLLTDAMDDAQAPADLVQVTHANYSPDTVRSSVDLGRRGCFVDVNPLLNPDRVAGAVGAVDAIAELVDQGVEPNRLTLSSDGNASVPRVRPDGSTEAFSYQLTLLATVRAVARADVLNAEAALALVTRNPATALRLPGVGTLAPGGAADIVAVDDEFVVRHVWSGGQWRVRDGAAVQPSMFRDPRWQQ